MAAARALLTDNVGIMNRAATEDVRSPVWPVISRVLRTGPAPSARDQEVVDVLDDWVARDAPRLDADEDGLYDEAGPAIMDAAWRPLAEAVVRPVFGDRVSDLNAVRGLGGLSGESYVDKDLRRLLGDSPRPLPPLLLRWRLSGGVPGFPLGRDPPGRGRTRGRAGGGRPRELDKAGGAHGLRPRAPPEHVPDHEPADLPAGARQQRKRR